MQTMPAVSLAATPGRRRAALDVGQELERRGFSGIYCTSLTDGLGLCEALALVTHEIQLGTAIANIYTRHPFDYAQTAAIVQELSGGRFWFGIGVSHGPTHERYGTNTGRPLADTRCFVEQLHAGTLPRDTMPPVVLATLRRRMVELAAEIGQGVIWANGARSHMAASLSHLQPHQRDDPGFFIGDMVPTCIDDDRQAAAALLRRILSGYVALPNYRNYWTEAGYGDEMEAIQQALTVG
ncbi:MAG: LLM class flavin-dependent oxidoreductase, partial [Dehalococcoidia bacterium]